MPYCSKCGTIIDNNTLFCPKCGSRVGVVVNVQQQQIQQFQKNGQKPFKPNSNMTFAIITTVLCCVPFGIYAIIQANKVDTLYYLGEYKKAEMAAQDAKKWSIIGIVTSFVGCILYILIILVLGIIGGEHFWEGFFNAL